MEVILLERIEKLGQIGDVVNVKPGHARNFLLPQRKALPATKANKEFFEKQRSQLEAQNLERKSEAEAVATKMNGTFVVMVRQAGDAGQLYGSVNARDIADALTEAGFTVNRQQIRLDVPIKAIGLHPVHVALHPEVVVEVTANVARSAEEARTQEETGQAVLSSEEQEKAAEAAEAVVAEEEALAAALDEMPAAEENVTAEAADALEEIAEEAEAEKDA